MNGAQESPSNPTIEQLEAKARLKHEMQERAMKEEQMRQEKEINQLKETMRLENEGQGVKEIKKERKEQLKQKARLKYAEIMKEQRTKQQKELSQLKETMRLETEKYEEQWERKQKLHEFEINQFEEKAKLASTEIERLRKENEQLEKLRKENNNSKSSERKNDLKGARKWNSAIRWDV